MELDITSKILGATFVMAVIMGAVTNRTNFCTMGAVSDWVNMGDTGRFRAWLLTIAVALAGALWVEWQGLFSFDDARIPYRHPTFAWPRYLLGGAMFGIGMTLAGGCGSKNLVRLGAGNFKSLFVVLIMGACAYLMTRTDFYGIVFASWVTPISLDLAAAGIESQEISRVIASFAGVEDVAMMRVIVGGILLVWLLWVTIGSSALRSERDNVVAGVVIGAIIFGGWYLTGGPLGAEWIEANDFADEPAAFVGIQSFTFVNPAGDIWAYAMSGADALMVTFGLVAVAGMIVGSFVYAVVSRGFRFEWFISGGDFVQHVIGAVLMGIGGVLGLGCTVGQGISGISTMAVGSVLTMLAIVISSALTMKVQYYKMLYDDASFGAAFITGLADLKLVPNSLRKFEAL